MEKQSSLVLLKEVFEGRRAPNAFSDIPQSALEIPNRSELAERCRATIVKATQSFDGVTKDNPGGTHERECCVRQYKPIAVEKVEDSIPLCLIVMKCFAYDKHSGQFTEEFHVSLVAENMLPASGEQAYAELIRIRQEEKNYIGTVLLTDRGDTFDLKELYVHPRYREKGFDAIFLSSAETFVGNIPRGKSEYKITANVGEAQLLAELHNNGFEAMGTEDKINMDKIFRGDSSLSLGEETYIFPSTAPFEQQTLRNRNEAIHVKLEKNIPSEVGAVGQIRHGMQGSISTVCGENVHCGQ